MFRIYRCPNVVKLRERIMMHNVNVYLLNIYLPIYLSIYLSIYRNTYMYIYVYIRFRKRCNLKTKMKYIHILFNFPSQCLTLERRKKSYVHIFYVYFQIATFLKAGVIIYISINTYTYIYIYIYTYTYIYICMYTFPSVLTLSLRNIRSHLSILSIA